MPTDFHSLLASFDLKRLTTTSTHKSGNQLDLIYTRDCTADNILVQPLHISDHFFIKFTLHFATRVPPTPYRLLFWRNLCSLSPSHLSSVVSSSLSLIYPFLISGCECCYWYFMLYFNHLSRWHLSSLLQASTNCPFNPGYLMFFVNIGQDFERQRENGEKSNEPSDLSMYQSFLSSFSAEVHTAKSSTFP